MPPSAHRIITNPIAQIKEEDHELTVEPSPLREKKGKAKKNISILVGSEFPDIPSPLNFSHEEETQSLRLNPVLELQTA